MYLVFKHSVVTTAVYEQCMMCVCGLYQELLAGAAKEMLRVREEILKTLPVREAHGQGHS